MKLPPGYRPEVRFARPSSRQILAEGYHPVDMHFHTVHSDGTVSIPSLIRTVRKTGIGCAVTDHNEVSGALAACRGQSDLLIVPGIEVSTADGPHILVYFYSPRDLEDFFIRHILPRRRESPWLLTSMTASDVLEAAEGYSCLRVPAHPYGYFIFDRGLAKCIDKGHLCDSLYARCDALEGLCANMGRAENLRAISLAERIGLPVTGGSDGHLIRDLGSAVTCTCSADSAGFLDEIRKGRACVVGEESSLPSRMLTAAAISARFMPWFLPSVRIHSERMVKSLNRYITGRKGRDEKRDGE